MAFLSFILIWRVLGPFIFFSALLSGLHRVVTFSTSFFNAVGTVPHYCWVSWGLVYSRAIQVDGVLVNWYSNRRCTEPACEIDMRREVYSVDMELNISYYR